MRFLRSLSLRATAPAGRLLARSKAHWRGALSEAKKCPRGAISTKLCGRMKGAGSSGGVLFLFRQEKYPKEAASREALTVKSIVLPSVSFPVTPISSRPPLRIPPGRFASVESSMFYSLLSNYNLTHCNEPGKNDRVTIPGIQVRIVSTRCPPNDDLSSCWKGGIV